MNSVLNLEVAGRSCGCLEMVRWCSGSLEVARRGDGSLGNIALGGFLMRRNLEMVSRGVGNQHASIGGGQTGGEDLVLMFDAIDKTLDYCW